MDDEALQEKLARMVEEHRDLDAAIQRLEDAIFVDQLQLRRLKKRKLQLKDYIDRLQSKLIPDLDA